LIYGFSKMLFPFPEEMVFARKGDMPATTALFSGF
jgi:hypothetical protein